LQGKLDVLQRCEIRHEIAPALLPHKADVFAAVVHKLARGDVEKIARSDDYLAG
jgi:hypothetical protein